MFSGIKKIWQLFGAPLQDNLSESSLVLQRGSIFSELNQEQLLTLAHICFPRRYDADEILFQEGDLAFALFMVQSGSIGIFLKNEDEALERITCFYQNDTFGEEALAFESKRCYQAAALEKSELLVIFRTDFEKLIELQPQIGLKIYQNIIQKISTLLLAKEDELRSLSNKLIKAKIIV